MDSSFLSLPIIFAWIGGNYMANQELPTIYSKKPEAPKEKKIEPVVNSNDYIIRKRPLFKRIVNIVLNGDVKEVKKFLINDVLIPSAKDTIFDMVNNGLYMLLYNSVRGRDDYKKSGPYISYNNYSSNSKSKVSYQKSAQREEIRDIDDIIFYERGKADLVLEEIFALYEEFHVVSKADVLQIISDKDDNFKYIGDFTDNNWGWDDLTGACVERVRGGYWLHLPKMIHLKFN